MIVPAFAKAMADTIWCLFERPLKDISFGHVLLRLFQTARRFHMEIQPQLVLLQKTLLNIEGLGRQLYPDLDLWQTAKPFLERWMDERIGIRAFIKGIRRNIPLWAENLPDFPMLIYEAVNQHQTQAERLKQINRELNQLRTDMQQRHKQTTLLLIGGLFVITASISLSIHNEAFLDINNNWIEMILGSVGSIMLLLAWITAR